MTELFQEGENISLIDGQTKLASMKLKAYGEETIRISKWKAIIKGQGYGKELIKKYIQKHPKVWNITTDGFTEAGAKEIQKALPNFKIIDWRKASYGAIGIIMRQDAIDYFIDSREKGKNTIFNIDSSFHSRNKDKVKIKRKDGIIQHYHKSLK